MVADSTALILQDMVALSLLRNMSGARDASADNKLTWE
jgi:hypothetical protein